MGGGLGRGALIVALTLVLFPALALAEEAASDSGNQDWLPPANKADLLVVSAHPDDELLFFGGTIPTYAGERGLTVQVAYMAHGVDDVRKIEAKNGLWLCGVKNEPVFLGFRDSYSNSLETAQRQWGKDKVIEALVGLIRQFRPEVIVTHDLSGEYGHGAHRITSNCMLEAVSLAADSASYPDSLSAYGPWQTKKLYLHLYKENPVTMDWTQPLSAFNGQTGLEIAQQAYNCHLSQLDYYEKIFADGRYSCAKYGLAFTTVGTDTDGHDFFEHIPPEELTNYVAPTPAPSPTPAPTGTPAPPAQTASAAPVQPSPPADGPALQNTHQTAVPIEWGLIGIGSLLSLLLTRVLLPPGVRLKKRSRQLRTLLVLLPAVVAGVICLVLRFI